MPPYRPRSVKFVSTTAKARPYPSVRRDYGARRSARATVAAIVSAGAGEMKYFDCELQTASLSLVTTTWVAGTNKDPTTTINLGDAAVATPGCLFAPKVSASLNGRIGRKVKMMKVKVRGSVQAPSQSAQGGGDTSTRVRLVLVMDTQTNAASMTGAQLFNDAGTANTTLSAFQNPNNFGRFKVLKDKWITLADPNMAGSPTTMDVIQGGLNRPFNFSYKFEKPVVVNFNATNGGTVADIIDNSLHIFCGIESAALTPTLNYYSRVSYKE